MMACTGLVERLCREVRIGDKAGEYWWVEICARVGLFGKR